MHISVKNNQKDLPISQKQVRALVNHVVFFEKKAYDEVTVYFVSKRKISQIHKQYFNDPSVTDCVSFPIDLYDNNLEGDYLMMGDLFVCPAVAIEYATAHKKNLYEEVSLYIVHGLLHLMGYDDIAINDRKEMRTAERRHLKALKKLGLLLKDPKHNQED